jgi:hypothetical protein
MPRLRWNYGGLGQALGHGLGQDIGHNIGLVHGLGHGHVHRSAHVITPLEGEKTLNTHLTGEATFLCFTYPLFVVSPTSPLEDVLFLQHLRMK